MAGRPLLTHVLERAKKIQPIDQVVLTAPPEDTALWDLAAEWFVPVVPRTPPNVLEGFQRAIQQEKADICVRLTGDNPLLAPALSAQVIGLYWLQPWAPAIYAHNLNPPTGWPEGLDTEVFPAGLLSGGAWTDREREHVTLRVAQVAKPAVLWSPVLAPCPRLTVDTAEDLERVRAIYAHLKPYDFSWQATLRAAKEAGI